MKFVAGNWLADMPVTAVKKRGRLEELRILKSAFRHESVKASDILAAEIVTETNRTSILAKVGWGAAGAVALGPLGLLAGVIGAGHKQERVIAIGIRDGRRALIKGTAAEAEMLLAAAFSNAVAPPTAIEAAPVDNSKWSKRDREAHQRSLLPPAMPVASAPAAVDTSKWSRRDREAYERTRAAALLAATVGAPDDSPA
jgi:hypothetical protein